MSSDIVVGNAFNKYGTGNPLYRAVVSGYFRSLSSLLPNPMPERILEVGCGEGHLMGWLSRGRPSVPVVGLDLSPPMLAQARRAYPPLSFAVGTAYQLPFPKATFDLVLAMEVLEHLDQPERALAEVRRVGRELVLASVPREPIWRALNMARFAYWSSWGNTPGHLNHWSKGDFVRLLKRYFTVHEVLSPFPWTMALCSI
jgi:SAM-dependent methyltransferase